MTTVLVGAGLLGGHALAVTAAGRAVPLFALLDRDERAEAPPGHDFDLRARDARVVFVVKQLSPICSPQAPHQKLAAMTT